MTRSGNGTRQLTDHVDRLAGRQRRHRRRARSLITWSSFRITDGENAGCTSLR